MKTILMTLLMFTALASFAAEPPVIMAEMSCDIYHTRIENGAIKESKRLISNKGKPFELGMAQYLNTTLPAPYQDVVVSFNHFLSYYNETGPTTSTPFVQAYFTYNKTTQGATRINFDIVNPENGSRILLRGTLGYAKESMLSYQCNFTYVK